MPKAPTFVLDPSAIVTSAVAQAVKTWSGHDRTDTVGASEVGDCARKVVYAKHGATPDPDFEQDYGASERGNVIEAWLVERMQQQLEVLRAAKQTDVELIFATDEGQKTLAVGAQSATPDGLFVSKKGFQLTNGVVTKWLYNEIKSKDPRVFDKIGEPDPMHVDQCQQGMDLLRRRTPHKPEWAVITYVNASFLSQRKTFLIQFDQAAADGLRARAEAILYSWSLENLPDPEGRMYFAEKPCEYCPYRKTCLGLILGSLPDDELQPPDEVVEDIGRLARDYKEVSAEVEQLEEEKSNLAAQIAQALTKAQTRRTRFTGGSVSVWSADPPPSFDIKKMQADGLPVDQYLRPPGERSVRVGVYLKK